VLRIVGAKLLDVKKKIPFDTKGMRHLHTPEAVQKKTAIA